MPIFEGYGAFKSYREDRSVAMKCSVQWSAVQPWTEFHLQQDLNPGPCDPKSEALTIRTPWHFLHGLSLFLRNNEKMQHPIHPLAAQYNVIICTQQIQRTRKYNNISSISKYRLTFYGFHTNTLQQIYQHTLMLKVLLYELADYMKDLEFSVTADHQALLWSWSGWQINLGASNALNVEDSLFCRCNCCVSWGLVDVIWN